MRRKTTEYRDYDQIYDELSQQPRMEQSNANKIIRIVVILLVLPVLLIGSLLFGVGAKSYYDMNKDKKVCTERVTGVVSAIDKEVSVYYDEDDHRRERVLCSRLRLFL